MKTQTVVVKARVTTKIRDRIAAGQERYGLARFDVALGYMLEGLLGRGSKITERTIAHWVEQGMVTRGKEGKR